MKAITKHRILYLAGDIFASMLGVLLFNIFRYWWIFHGTCEDFIRWSYDPHVVIGYAVFPAIFILISGIAGFYNDLLYKSRYEIISNSMLSSFLGSLAIYFAIMVDDDFHERALHYSFLIAMFVSFSFSLLLVRYIISTIFRARLMNGINTYNVIVVGPIDKAQKFAVQLEKTNARIGYRVVGLAGDNGETQSPTHNWPVYSLDGLNQAIKQHDVKAFVVLSSREDIKHSVDIINRLYGYGLSILLPLDFYNLVTSRPKLTNVIGEPLVEITSSGMSPAASNIKRISDIVISAIAIIVLIPVYIVLAIAIKLDSPGPVLYRQERVGLHRRTFRIIKFRSMIENSEPDGPALSSSNDSRVTKIGRTLRKYRLDELPQFLNVLRGDMSLVGPRPEREHFLKLLMAKEPSVCTIHKIRPGLTSLGTVKFGYASDVDSMVKRLYYDLLYLENMSLSFDLKIIFHTVNTILTGKGV